jgi:predicted HTH domain antitoxin
MFWRGRESLTKRGKLSKIHKIYNLRKIFKVELFMVYQQRISKTDLARNTRRVIRDAQRGYTLLVENHGQVEVAIMDIMDFQIQRAAIKYFSKPKKFNQDIDLTDDVLESISDEQARCDLVIGHYLAVHISFGRAAELLNLPFDDLRSRLLRIGVPLQVGPESADDLKEDVNNIE